MILSYSDFISESIWNNAVIFTLSKPGGIDTNDKPYRMYYFEDEEYGTREIANNPKFKHLKLSIRYFQHTSEHLYFYFSQHGLDDNGPYYHLRKNEEEGIKDVLEGVNNLSYPQLYELQDGDYLEFGDHDAWIGHNAEHLILSSDDHAHEYIKVHRNPKKFYPLTLDALNKHEFLNDIKDTKFEFVDKAEGFEETDFYKSISTAKKYKLFDYASFNESNEETFEIANEEV